MLSITLYFISFIPHFLANIYEKTRFLMEQVSKKETFVTNYSLFQNCIIKKFNKIFMIFKTMKSGFKKLEKFSVYITIATEK